MKASVLQNPQFRRLFGGNGANNGLINQTAGLNPWVDQDFQIPQNLLGIYIPYLGMTQVNSNGASRVHLFMCPESERVKPAKTYKQTLVNGGASAEPTSDYDRGFIGVPIPISSDLMQTGSETIQGRLVMMLRPLFVPQGYFIRGIVDNITAQVAAIVAIEFTFYNVTDPCFDMPQF